MSFNLKVLIKIQNATANNVKSRTIIANYIVDFEEKINKANTLSPPNRKKELLHLMNEETALRKKALISGISTFSDPNWAAPTVCETWVLCLLGSDNKEAHIAKQIIHELKKGQGVEPLKDGKLDYLVILFVFPISFYFLNWWSALIALVIVVSIIVWKYKTKR